MKEIYLIESATLMNGIEWEFNNMYYASSFEKAKEYIEKYVEEFKNGHLLEDEQDCKIEFNLEQRNDSCWVQEIDYDSQLFITKRNLDTNFWWREDV